MVTYLKCFKIVIFHGYVSLPEGSSFVQIRGHQWEAQQKSHISKPEVRQFHLEIRLARWQGMQATTGSHRILGTSS